MNEIICPECGCKMQLKWKQPEEVKQTLQEKTEDALGEHWKGKIPEVREVNNKGSGGE